LVLGNDEAATRLQRGGEWREILEAMRGELEEFLHVRVKYFVVRGRKS